MILVVYLAKVFNRVWTKHTKKTVKQAIDDLKKCKLDCDKLEAVFALYGFTNPKNIYRLSDPDVKQVNAVRNAIPARFKEEPEKKFAVVILVAGHGIQFNGQQSVVINAFDKNSRFYRLWPVENDIRNWTEDYSNAYIVSFFACCRELHNVNRHSGCYGGTSEEALK